MKNAWPNVTDKKNGNVKNAGLAVRIPWVNLLISWVQKKTENWLEETEILEIKSHSELMRIRGSDAMMQK